MTKKNVNKGVLVKGEKKKPTKSQKKNKGDLVRGEGIEKWERCKAKAQQQLIELAICNSQPQF